MQVKGKLIVISGPSGVGKGTVCAELIRMRPELNLSISATTRPKRPMEEDGKNYYFYSIEDFSRLIEENQLIEFAQVHNNYYGTPRAYVEEKINQSENVILEIDVQGASQVKRNFPDGVFIFLLPPKYKDLEDRLRGRGTEEEEEIRLRLKNSEKELAQLHDYDYAVVNENVPDAAKEVSKIIDAESHRINKELIEAYGEVYHDKSIIQRTF